MPLDEDLLQIQYLLQMWQGAWICKELGLYVPFGKAIPLTPWRVPAEGGRETIKHVQFCTYFFKRNKVGKGIEISKLFVSGLSLCISKQTLTRALSTM